MGNTWRTVNAIYQLSVRSFQDSNGDGIGDIPGIIARLPYLKGETDSLGVDAIAVTPLYPSPMRDFGYDITDFTNIAPEYGTLDDFDRLLEEAHRRGIKVMLDLVVNHTSDQHEWFEHSRRSRNDSKRDWYIWRDPAPDGGAPNNWTSKFGGGAWEFDEGSGQYYLHTFLKEQPDLNWQNPEVRIAMQQVMRFWLDRGVDGFRVDAAIYVAKDFTFTDNPPNPNYMESDREEFRFIDSNISYGDDLVPFLGELVAVLGDYDNTVMTFEAFPEGKRVGVDRHEMFASLSPEHVMPMVVETTWVDPTTAEFTQLLSDIDTYVTKKGSMPIFPFGNHDRSRLATRYGDEKSRLVAEMQLCLPGIPVIYYGDEIGLRDVAVPKSKQTDFAKQIWVGCRDSFRTPMQWDKSEFAGFSNVESWLPVGDKTKNVYDEQRDEQSLLSLYKRLLSERRALLMNEWRDTAVLYQIYPRSYKDTNSDGIGDIRGIISSLDYIKGLADALWLSPIFASPQKDFGYDVSSFVDIQPEYGTFEDFDELLAEAHARGMKVMMDFTPNHTSDQHDWFQQSRSSRDNPKRNWYVWRDTPNNWVSLAGGSSWTYDEATQQYYLHSWMANQPDLNWQNPEVRRALYDSMRFWFDRGVDGFRVDAVWVLAKDEDLADDILHDSMSGKIFSDYSHVSCRNGARLREYLGSMAAVAAQYRNKFLVFEYYSSYEFGDSYQQLYDLQSINPRVATTFFFDAMQWRFDAQAMGQGVAAYLSGLPNGATPVFTFGNHDQTRIVTRFGGEPQARSIAFMQLTLPGMPCVYYGEELGMEDTVITTGQDGFGSGGMFGGRDPERTPMQWNTEAQAGFTTNNLPWLPVAQNYITHNVKTEDSSDLSFLALYRSLVALRRKHVAFRSGTFKLLGYDNNILAYDVVYGVEHFRVLINFANIEQPIAKTSGVLLSSLHGHAASQYTRLAPFEAILIAISASS